MLTGENKGKIDKIWNTFWSGGISDPLRVIEQISFLLFIKRLDDIHTTREKQANRLGKPIKEPIFGPDEPLMAALGLPYPTIVGKVAGGAWASSVMDRVVAEGRYGVRLGQTPASAADELRACIRAACADDPFLAANPATVEITGARFGSARVAADHPLPAGLIATARAVTGRRPQAIGVPYGADMRLFIDVGDTPCVIFGPGDVRLAHGANESVPLAEVEACARVLAAWVADQLGA